MLVAQSRHFAGQGHVQRFGDKARLLLGRFDLFFFFCDFFFDLRSDLIGDLTDDGSFLRRKLAHLLEDGGQFALFAKEAHPHGFQLGRRTGCADGFLRRLRDCFELIFQIYQSFPVLHHKSPSPATGRKASLSFITTCKRELTLLAR